MATSGVDHRDGRGDVEGHPRVRPARRPPRWPGRPRSPRRRPRPAGPSAGPGRAGAATSATAAWATDTLPPDAPSMMRPRNSSGMAPGHPVSRLPTAVPNRAMISTGLRPIRSDSRPHTGAQHELGQRVGRHQQAGGGGRGPEALGVLGQDRQDDAEADQVDGDGRPDVPNPLGNGWRSRCRARHDGARRGRRRGGLGSGHAASERDPPPEVKSRPSRRIRDARRADASGGADLGAGGGVLDHVAQGHQLVAQLVGPGPLLGRRGPGRARRPAPRPRRSRRTGRRAGRRRPRGQAQPDGLGDLADRGQRCRPRRRRRRRRGPGCPGAPG